MSKTDSGNYLVQLKNLVKPYYLPYLHRFIKSRANKQFKAHGNEVLLRAKAALDEIGVHCWLDFGTLLGVYRDGKLIAHDFDVDMGMFLEDYSPKVEETLIKHGFKRKHRFEIDEGKYGLEQSFTYRNIGFDIFYYSRDGENMYCHLFPLDKDKNRLVREIYTKHSGFKTVTFLDQEFNIPADTEQRLIDTYGEDFRIPISNWNTPNDALNSKIIDKNCKEYKFH